MAIYSSYRSSLNVPIYAGWRCSKCNEINISKGELNWSQSGMASGSKEFREHAIEVNEIDLQREWPERTLAVIDDPKGLAKVLRHALRVGSVTCSRCNTTPEWAQIKSLKYASKIASLPDIYMPVMGTLNREFIEYADKHGKLVPTPEEAIRVVNTYLPQIIGGVVNRSTISVLSTDNNAAYTPAKQEKLFCRKCGKELLLDSLFCNYCGAKVEQIQPEISDRQERLSPENEKKTSSISLSMVVQASLKIIRKDKSIEEVYGWDNAPKSLHEMIIYVYKFKGTEEELKKYLDNAVAAQIIAKKHAAVFLEEWKEAKRKNRTVDADALKCKNIYEYRIDRGLCPSCGGELKKGPFRTKCLSCGNTI